jgi:hypothetical protein
MSPVCHLGGTIEITPKIAPRKPVFDVATA